MHYEKEMFVSQNHFSVVFPVSFRRGVCICVCRIISSAPPTLQNTVLCVCVHAHLPLAHLNVCNVGNEQPELVRHNNVQGRDEMDSMQGVSLLALLSWLP